MTATQAQAPGLRATARRVLRKGTAFLVVTLVFGWFYGWASPGCFRKNVRVGFGYGMLHGALMPMALPSLAMGNDVEIYAVNNSGRAYKLGYITGINVCGLLFFGSVFWRPRRTTQAVAPDCGSVAHKNQPR